MSKFLTANNKETPKTTVFSIWSDYSQENIFKVHFLSYMYREKEGKFNKKCPDYLNEWSGVYYDWIRHRLLDPEFHIFPILAIL